MAANGGRRKPSTNERLILELSSIKAAINNNTRAVLAHSANTAKWLGVVAEAAANPVDNTAEVKEKLAELARELKGEADAFEALSRETTTNQEGE